MGRTPNYDFERKERQRIKAEKKAARAAEKEKARLKDIGTDTGSGDDDVSPASHDGVVTD